MAETHWRVRTSTGQFATCRTFPAFRDTVTDDPVYALRCHSAEEARIVARQYLGSVVERVEHDGRRLSVTIEPTE